jgi:hypothetical protein
VRHPDPTQATVKQLFGTARECAEPNCHEPLYRPAADGSGDLVLNVRIAHICAASENGPRWDPGMDAETNRSGPNLLLLSLDHAEEIDVREHSYPATLLRRWKAVQIAAGAGTAITDEQAHEAVVMSRVTEINIQAAFLNLGGQGGQALGAAGGGGAAIGDGAVGGPGGAAAHINVDGQPGDAPGAGGGGGGWLAPGLRETTKSAAWLGGGTSEGTDGQPGGYTFITSEDGEELLRATGGGGGLTGNADRRMSELFSVSTFMCLDCLHLRDGLAYVMEGGYSWYRFLDFPADHSFAILLAIEAPSVPVGTYTFHVSAHDPDGTQQGGVSFPVTVTEEGSVLRIQRGVDLHARVEYPGVWTLRVGTDVATLAEIDVVLKLY